MPDVTATEMALPLNARRFSSRQQEVLDVLEDVFSKQGLRQVTIGELAMQGHCSRRTLYELAASKEELFLLVLDRMARRVARHAAEAVAAEKDPAGKIAAYLGGGLPDIQALTHVFSESIESYAPAGWLLRHHLNEARATLVALIEDAISKSVFRSVDAAIAADAILAGTSRLLEPEVLKTTKLTSQQVLDEFFSILLDGLRLRGRADARSNR